MTMNYLNGLIAAALLLATTNADAKKQCARVKYSAGAAWVETVPCPK